VNSVWNFIKFCGSLQQITLNSTAHGHVKENQLSCSKQHINQSINQ